MNQINRTSVYKTARMNQLIDLCEKPMSLVEITEVMGVQEETIRIYIRHLTAQQKIYISDWKLHKNQRETYFPLFMAGDLLSVDRPLTVNGSRSRAYRERLIAGHVPVRLEKKVIKPKVNFNKQSWFSGLI